MLCISIHKYYMDGDQTLLARGWGARGAASLRSTGEREVHQVPEPEYLCCYSCGVSLFPRWGLRSRNLSSVISIEVQTRIGHRHSCHQSLLLRELQFHHWDCHLLPPFCILCPAGVRVLSLNLAFLWLGAAFLIGSRLCCFQDPINSAFSHTELWDFYGYGKKMHK